MRRLMAVVALLALAGIAALAQPAEEREDLERVAAEQEINRRIEHFVQMGMEREAAVFMTILERSGMDPAQMVLFFMMAEENEDAAGLMLLMNAMKQKAAAQPVVIDSAGGLWALIVEDGVLYLIDLDAMEVRGSVEYAPRGAPEDDAIWSLLAPMMAGGEEPGGPEAAECREHLHLLWDAFAAYMQDHNGALPGQNWVEAVTPYLETPEPLHCPERPDLEIAYAMNEKLVGALMEEVVEPGESILLFEAALDAPNPVGGPAAVPDEGVHDEGVNVLFANGEVEWLPADEAREMLGFPVGE